MGVKAKAAALAGAAASLVAGIAGGSALAASSAPTRARALTYARAVNLKQSDLPGFRPGKSEQESSSEKQIGKSFERCAGGASFNRENIAKAESPDFEDEAVSVQSEVAVVRSAGIVRHELSVIRSGRTLSCLRTAVGKLTHHKLPGGVVFTGSKVETSTPTVSGSDGAFEFDMRLDADSRGKHFPVYITLVGFEHGQAEISLMLASAIQRIDIRSADALLTLLNRRALAASL